MNLDELHAWADRLDAAVTDAAPHCPNATPLLAPVALLAESARALANGNIATSAELTETADKTLETGNP